MRKDGVLPLFPHVRWQMLLATGIHQRVDVQFAGLAELPFTIFLEIRAYLGFFADANYLVYNIFTFFLTALLSSILIPSFSISSDTSSFTRL